MSLYSSSDSIDTDVDMIDLSKENQQDFVDYHMIKKNQNKSVFDYQEPMCWLCSNEENNREILMQNFKNKLNVILDSINNIKDSVIIIKLE